MDAIPPINAARLARFIAIKRCLALQSTVRAMIVVVVLPLTDFLIEQVNVVRDPVLIEYLIELLVVDSV